MIGRGEDIPASKKLQIAQFLLGNCTPEHVVHNGKVKEAATLFGVSRRYIHRVWTTEKEQIEQGIPISFVSNKLGFSKPRTNSLDLEMMRYIPFNKRCTIRRLAKELSVSKSQVGRLVKRGKIKADTNAIKPSLTEANQLCRLNFSLHQLIPDQTTQTIRFNDMFHVVHIDEKWFYMSRECERYYILPGENEPHRTCKSKRFIPKVMFMCAVAIPRFSSEGDLLFDGKIVMWPFTEVGKAQRNSKNRLKGTPVIKPIDSITKEVTKAFILNKVIPAIKQKWPSNASKHIIIQQDNARPHISNEDPDFQAAATSDEFNIQLLCQPPNSPDTNINDLGWFRAIQSLQVDTASYTVEDLLKNVKLSYDNLDPQKLNYVFLTLQTCLKEILKCNGQNTYKIPHIGKDMLLREGRLPLTIEVEHNIVRDNINTIMEIGRSGHLLYDISRLVEFMGY